MAKDVKFNIRLNIDGKEQIVIASTNVKELAKELNIAEDKTSKLKDAMGKWTNAVVGLQAPASPGCL